jgi:hypothetical protein
MAESREPESHTLSGTQPFPAVPSTLAGLLSRLDEFFQSGGLFNPELAIHDNVRELLWDIREYLAEGDVFETQTRQGS